MQSSVIDQTELVITRLIFNYFAEHDRQSTKALSTITSRWRRSYFYIVAVYHDNSLGEDSPNYEERLARLEYVSCQSLSLVYRRLGWFKNFLVYSNGGTFPMLVCSLS